MELDSWDLGADRYLREGVTITPAEMRRLTSSYDAALLGALGDPRVPDNAHARDILLGLRRKADLYVNRRPAELLFPSLSPLRRAPPMRIVVFRENTEGFYVDAGGRLKPETPGEVATQEGIHTRLGVERITRAAFRYARGRGLRLVTLVDKANALTHSGALWRSVFASVGEEYGEIRTEALYVDAAAMDLVRRPDRFQVILTCNLFGDILSDICGELMGGLGLAPSCNEHPGGWAFFEPVHGSAPDIAGKGIANPVASIRSAAMALRRLGFEGASDLVEEAARRSIAEGVRTPDIGGRSSTAEVGRWVAAEIDRAATDEARPRAS